MEHCEHRFCERERREDEYAEAFDSILEEVEPYFEDIEGVAEIFTEEWGEDDAKSEIINYIPSEHYEDDVWDMTLEELSEFIKPYEKTMLKELEDYVEIIVKRRM